MFAIKRILAPTDFDDCSSPTLRYAAGLAEKFGAELILLNVVPDVGLVMPDAVMPAPVPEPVLGELLAAARKGLEKLAENERLGRLQLKLDVRLGTPAAEIVSAATDLKVDLICLGTHGRSGLANFLLGSVAETVVRRAPCPVLTIRPDAK